MRKIAVANYKGGVAKTQTAYELSYWLARRGKRVLVFDTDPQANITSLLLAGNTPVGRSLPEILISGQQVSVEDINTKSIDEGHSIDFVASNMNLGRIEGRISTSSPKEYIIPDLTSEICKKYQFVIFDTAPSAELLGLSTLLAVDDVIIPTCMDRLSVSGTIEMMDMVHTIKTNVRLNPSINILAILVTRYRRTLSTIFQSEFIKKQYGDYLIDTFVRESTRVQQASNVNKTIQEYDSDNAAAKDYDKVFQKLFPGLRDIR